MQEQHTSRTSFSGWLGLGVAPCANPVAVRPGARLRSFLLLLSLLAVALPAQAADALEGYPDVAQRLVAAIEGDAGHGFAAAEGAPAELPTARPEVRKFVQSFVFELREHGDPELVGAAQKMLESGFMGRTLWLWDRSFHRVGVSRRPGPNVTTHFLARVKRMAEEYFLARHPGLTGSAATARAKKGSPPYVWEVKFKLDSNFSGALGKGRTVWIEVDTQAWTVGDKGSDGKPGPRAPSS